MQSSISGLRYLTVFWLIFWIFSSESYQFPPKKSRSGKYFYLGNFRTLGACIFTVSIGKDYDSKNSRIFLQIWDRIRDDSEARRWFHRMNIRPISLRSYRYPFSVFFPTFFRKQTRRYTHLSELVGYSFFYLVFLFGFQMFLQV